MKTEIDAAVSVVTAEIDATILEYHAFDNDGMSTGLCKACNRPAPDHALVKLKQEMELRTGADTLPIDYYESSPFPSGSVAVLKDGRRLVRGDVYEKLHTAYMNSLNAGDVL